MGAKLLDSLYLSGFGAIAASGSVSFYQPGTLTPVTVFSDDTLLTIQTQPIVLDVNGKTPLPVYTATPLRAIIKGVAGNVLADVARIDGERAELVQVSNPNWPLASTLNDVLNELAASTGGLSGQFLDAGAGAVPRSIQAKFAEVQVSVKDFGAVGNGIADDTVSCQAAINRITTLGGGTVYFPPGTYLISSALTVTIGMHILGAVGSTVIQQSSATVGIFSVNVPGIAAVYVDSLTLTNSSTSSGTAITMTSGALFLSGVTSMAFFETVVSMPQTSALLTASIFNSTIQQRLSASASTLSVTGLTNVLVSNSRIFAGTSGTAITYSPTSNVALAISSSQVGGAANGISITRGYLLMSSTDLSGSSAPLTIGASTDGLFVNYDTCRVTSAGVVDSRTTTAPVFYTFATSGNFTPLPLQAGAIKAIATAAATITINAISATGWGRKWSLICSCATAGSVTWTFNAQYVLSAAVTPSNGNRVNLLLEYNPADGKVYEIGRAATAN